MLTPEATPLGNPEIPKQTPLLTYLDLRPRFPHVLDIRSDEKGGFNPNNTPVREWFRTESTDLVAPPAVVQTVGRAYFVKEKEPIDLGEVRRYLRQHLNGSADQPIPLNKLSRLVAGAVYALTKTRKKKQIPSLKYVDLRVRFPHLFAADAVERIQFRTRKKAVSLWLESPDEELVDPAALATLTARVFFLKYRQIINPTYINAYLRQTGTTQPVPLKDLSRIVAEAVATLIKGPTEKPDRRPAYVAAERPVKLITSIFTPRGRNKNKDIRDIDSKINKKNPEYIISAARGLITRLKGTTGGKPKGTEKEICTRVFKKMKKMRRYYKVDETTLHACITAAWDQLGGYCSDYESNKGGSGSASNKPINLKARTR